jgi:hypothetical protein
MAEGTSSGAVLDALLRELSVQGHAATRQAGERDLTAYPVGGTINLLALAEAVESALRGDTSDEEEAKTPAELNAANDG